MPEAADSKSTFGVTLEALVDELWDHANVDFEGSGLQVPEVALRGCFRSSSDLARANKASNGGGLAQFDLWWTNCPATDTPKLLWQRWECHGISRGDYEGLLREAHERDLSLNAIVDDHEWLGERAKLQPLPTWKYHPERMRGVMPYAEEVAAIGRKCHGNPGVPELNALAGVWAQPPHYSLAARPLRERIHSPERNSRAISRIVELLMFNAVFCGHGRQIFDIPEQLCAMFRRTDIDGIAAENIKVPYSGLYLHFGPQADLALDGHWTPEGAYVYELKDDDGGNRCLQFCIVSAPCDLERYREFDTNIEPIYVQSLGQQHMKMSLGEAVEMVLSEDMRQLRRQISDEPMNDMIGEVAAAMTGQGTSLVSSQASLARQELDALAPQHRVYQEMLRLVVNSLAYITAYPKDVQTTWPPNAPTRLVKQLAATDSRNERRRIQSKMAALGFSPVHLCGRTLCEELKKKVATKGDVRTLAAHWRRGHWRRQQHGPNNVLRKLVWLMPTLVNSGLTDGGPELMGHIYLS